MNPRLRDELVRKFGDIDREIKNMAGNDRGGGRPSWMGRRAAPQELPEATGWSVPVELNARGRDGDGKVVVYLSFPPETFNDAEAIIDSLISEGLGVKVWTPKRDDRPAYNGNGGGYPDRNGGGFNRGGGGGYNGGGRRW